MPDSFLPLTSKSSEVDRFAKRHWLRLISVILVLSVYQLPASADEPSQEKKRPTTPLLRPLAEGEAGAPAFAGKFAIDRDQTCVIIGSTNALESQRQGYLETRLAMTYPKHRLRLRNMAWQADTVYRQQRPRHFFQAPPDYYRGEADRRQPIPVDTIFLWMGQSESLDGLNKLDEFAKAYRETLDQLKTMTPRIVLVTPVPFEPIEATLIDIDRRNKTLQAYAITIQQIGQERQLPVVDLFGELDGHSGKAPLTRNGMHLTKYGHALAAHAFADQLALGKPLQPITASGPDGSLKQASAEAIRQLVIDKNDLWFRYWRPTNWAFLYGNRQEQPSSRDHQDRKHRWFPKAVAEILPRVEKVEDAIHASVSKLTTSNK